MDAIVFLGIPTFAFVTYLILVAVIHRSARRPADQEPDNTDREAVPSRGRVAANGSRPPRPFNQAGAKPVHEPPSLRGSAYIVDGDTIVIQKTQIRLFGIDAPELSHPYGQKAKWALLSLCKGQMLTAKILSVDTHGRTVARCYLSDGRDVSAEMVKKGLALDWPKFSGGEYRALELPDARKKLWLADARQKGRTDVWQRFDEQQRATAAGAGRG